MKNGSNSPALVGIWIALGGVFIVAANMFGYGPSNRISTLLIDGKEVPS